MYFSQNLILSSVLSFVIGLSVHMCVRTVRNKLLSPFYSNEVWCIHQTCTNCSSWHDLLMPHGGLCPRPTFHAKVTMVRKKWLSLYYSIYQCYIHQTCTNCSSWHDLLMPRGGLFPWPTFHASVTMVRKKWLSLYYSTYQCYIHQTCTNCSSWHDLLMPRGGLCPWPTFHFSVTKTQNDNTENITVISSLVCERLDSVFKNKQTIKSIKCAKNFHGKVPDAKVKSCKWQRKTVFITPYMP